MELSWLMKSRIAAAVAVGVVLIGVLGWPLAAAPSPFEAVRAGSVGYHGAVILVVLAFLAGLAAYFASWPHGRQIGILAVPSGLAVWASRSGSMAELMQMNATASQRLALYKAFCWEPLFWLVIVGAGFVGVLLGQRICPKPEPAQAVEEEDHSRPKIYPNEIIGLVASVLIAQFCIGMLTKDVELHDSTLGSAMGQPAIGQIVFGVVVSFGLAAFAVKSLLGISYIGPIIASGLITAFATTFYVKRDALQNLADRLPAVFFSNPVLAVLPVQMVAFGTLGSIAGYWMAVRCGYWRKHEAQ